MVKTLADLNKQLAELEEQAKVLRRQAEDIRNSERASVIDELRRKIIDYGLTAADLKLTSGGKPRGKRSLVEKAPAKYRGPNGELWSGGRGRKPAWVAAAAASGKPLSDFEV